MLTRGPHARDAGCWTVIRTTTNGGVLLVSSNKDREMALRMTDVIVWRPRGLADRPQSTRARAPTAIGLRGERAAQSGEQRPW